MEFEGDMGTNWRRFKTNLDLYMKATGCSDRGNEIQAAVFLHCVGEPAREIFETFELSAEDKKNVNAIIRKFDEYFLPKVNKSIERHKFNTRTQLEDEPFDNFIKDLRKIASNCEFGRLKDELIKDRIVCGIRDRRVKDRLLREANLNLEKAIEICKAAEITDKHMENLKNEMRSTRQAVPVDGISKNTATNQQRERGRDKHWRGPNTSWQAGKEREVRGHDPNARRGQKEDTFAKECGRCGNSHAWQRCPAFEKICARCGKKNHFARVCKSKSDSKRHLRQVHNINSNESNECVNNETVEHYSLGLLNAIVNDNDWYQNFKIFGNNIKFKLDTGAQINVIPNHLAEKLLLKYGKCNTKIRVTNYGGSELTVLGSCCLNIKHNNKIHEVDFFIIETNLSSVPIIGIKTIKSLKLLERTENSKQINEINTNLEEIIEKYKDVFEGLGNIECKPCEFALKENYTPVVASCRKVPFSLEEKLKNTLKRMVNDKVIVEVKEPTEFVHPIVLVNKTDREVRICLDPQNLNKILLREHYKLPTFEEITQNLKGSKFFTTLDANKGFWQIKLSDKASNLTTFTTPFGRYKFLRLPFGVSNAPEIFHRTFSEIFEDIENVKIYIDDIIIFAKNRQQHDEILEKVLKRAREKGVKFNKKKCKIGVNKVKYIGHEISEKGISVDQDKVEAIKQIKKPQNTKELQRFLGMITYVGKFIPNLSEKTSNLRQLIKKNMEFIWLDAHEKEFNNLKNLLMSSPVLKFFDNNKPIILSVDSSKDGMGAVLLQDGAPVAYASKSLNDTQKQYAQIEKETLAIAFGCQRFHQYVFGKQFTVESDHRPLEIIFKKPLDQCPLRIQRLRITLQNYDFIVKFKNGSKLYLADALSRAHYNDKNFEVIEKETELHVNFIKYISMSPQKFEELRKQNETDNEIIELKRIIKEGWPTSKNNLLDSLKPFWKARYELVVNDGIVFKGNQIVVPKTMRSDIIDRLHYNHLGIEKTCLRAKEHVFWPFMIKELTEKIKNCPACLTHSKSNQKETLINKNIPIRPWEIISADFFKFKNQEYLLIVDEYSKYPEVICLGNNTTSPRVIRAFKEILARHGKPNLIFTDNGPQFTNYEFKQFVKSWEISHKTSSPHYPQSNGFIERHVQTIKKMLLKCLYDNKDLYLTLLEYRSSPITSKIPSPAEILFGRKIKNQLPIKESLLQPHSKFKINEFAKRNKIKERNYYNRQAKDLTVLKEGDKVVIQNYINKLWEPGTVVRTDTVRPRSYIVKFDKTGHTLIRNRKFLRKITTNNFINNDDTFNDIIDSYISSNVNTQHVNNNTPINENRTSLVEPNVQCSNNFKSEIQPTTPGKVMTRSGRIISKPRRYLD